MHQIVYTHSILKLLQKVVLDHAAYMLATQGALPVIWKASWGEDMSSDIPLLTAFALDHRSDSMNRTLQ